MAEPESWLALVYTALREPGSYLTVSSGPPNVYAQAINHEGHFDLEYRDGSPDRHFTARDVSLESIADALSPDALRPLDELDLRSYAEAQRGSIRSPHADACASDDVVRLIAA